jgi:hypothetical protein
MKTKLLVFFTLCLFTFAFFLSNNYVLTTQAKASLTLDVLDVRGLPYDMRLSALTLQGIINAKSNGTLIYLLESHANYDEQWLTYYQTNYSARVEYYTFQNLLNKYKNEVGGYVVYDPSAPASQFIAATISGLNGSITVSPELVSAVEGFGIPLDVDLRGKFVSGNTIAIYEWGYNNLFPLCNRTIIGNMIYNDADDGYYDIYMQIIDYLVANKAFIMGLSSTTEPDHTLKQYFLNGMDKNGWVVGWFGPDDYEWAHVTQTSETGLTVVGSFPAESPNYSVHSKIIPQPPSYKQNTNYDNLIYDKNKTYVTFIVTDGDALWTANSRYRNNWDNPLRGKIKIGWQVGLAFTSLCPDILSYLYSTQSPNDEFVGGCSGVGYFYPDMMPNSSLSQHLTTANEAMHVLGLKDIFVITHRWPSTETLK